MKAAIFVSIVSLCFSCTITEKEISPPKETEKEAEKRKQNQLKQESDPKIKEMLKRYCEYEKDWDQELCGKPRKKP